MTNRTMPDGARKAWPLVEVWATWALWGALLLALGVTYTRLDPSELYHVSNDGLAGGLSRMLVQANFPVALVAIALILIAIDSLPARAWSVGAPAIALCAVTALPGVVDDGDLDARWINVVPAIGVVLAIGLTVAAFQRSDRATDRAAPSLQLDGVRKAIVVITVIVSLPWILADLGWYAPDGLFIMERPITGSDGNASPAVHLGHHHGFDGALLVISAALLSRVRLRSSKLAMATTLYVSLVFAYGAVNALQDGWNEQLVKRGWADWEIPNAVHPSLEPTWLVIVAIAAATAFALRREAAMQQSLPEQLPVA